MADLVIRGMEMPLECNWKTIRLYPNGTCAFQNGEGDYNVIPYAAIQLPAEHGRLIDGDAVTQEAYRSLLECEKYGNEFEKPYAVIRAIETAKTIVPAEGGGEDGNV